MGIRRAAKLIVRVALAGLTVLLLTALCITVFTVAHKQSSQNADVIVVLGAGMDPDGTLHREAIQRVSTGVALFNKGRAPRIHFTGGRARLQGPGAGDQMAALAMSMGVAEAAISRENESLSTLQNAHFSAPMLAGAKSVILVTEAFHLPRSAASFWWMGQRKVSLVHSARFRRTASGGISLSMIGRETLAIWFNLARATVWSLSGKQHDHLLQ